MINLIRNELMKIFRRPGTYVMIGILVVIVSITGVFMKYNLVEEEPNVTEDWKPVLQQENEALKSQLESSPIKLEQDFYKKQIAINEYRIEHDIPFREKYNVWSFVKDSSELILLAGLFTIVVSAGIVASEFNWGTIKLLLIRPINRSKILLSKYLTVLLFALLMIGILFGFSAILGAILFGFPEQTLPYLNYFNGKVTQQHIIVYLIIYYGLGSIDMIMLTTMAFMISSVFRNSSLAIGLSLFLMFTGSQFTALISMKFDWAKYILFANTNLMQYIEGTPLLEGMTMSFSIIVLIIYFVIFQFLAFFVFNKRDVAA
ncbi:ABC transporter permease [Bacillus sp. EB106-08-02-XG196]|jgi:ABC-2 type transport system permease protein|uniref:ABC transporter permease n=1 Tax=Bacillus sp. EB106-08-02-XG196 TaxID=2737049 RepID=UPI0015C45D3C|nr:ABC transporter permease [Bacillus sp. EB106-08-02-XG196]NWQ40141.1 ABC transporter permease [Bacillus sp. EB106-08-02-XG196]